MDFFNAFDDGFDDVLSSRGSVAGTPANAGNSSSKNMLGDLQREIHEEESKLLKPAKEETKQEETGPQITEETADKSQD